MVLLGNAPAKRQASANNLGWVIANSHVFLFLTGEGGGKAWLSTKLISYGLDLYVEKLKYCEDMGNQFVDLCIVNS